MGLGLDVGWGDVARRLGSVGWRPVVGVVAVVVLVVGGCFALRSDERAAAVVLPRAAPVPAPSTTTALETGAGDATASAGGVAEIVVHAAGALRRPGVYRMPSGARIVDLLEAAGGPTPGADLRGVNLAAVLSDGVRVYFPRSGEEPPAEVDIVPDPPPHPAAAGEPGSGAASPPAPLDVNAATAAELERLPGIGPVTAAAIVEHRERVGPFQSVEALGDVSGIGPVKLGRIGDLVTVAP